MIEDPSKWVEKADGWDADQHYIDRRNNGFSKADWINFDTYLAWIIANAIQKFKDEGAGMFCYPNEPEENWEALTNAEYDVMIQGFGDWAADKWGMGSHEEQVQVVRNLEDALELFKSRFTQLWD